MKFIELHPWKSRINIGDVLGRPKNMSLSTERWLLSPPFLDIQWLWHNSEPFFRWWRTANQYSINTYAWENKSQENILRHISLKLVLFTPLLNKDIYSKKNFYIKQAGFAGCAPHFFWIKKNLHFSKEYTNWFFPNSVLYWRSVSSLLHPARMFNFWN